MADNNKINLLFKKGSYNNFQNNVLNGNKAVEGALYLTEDEGALYLGQSGGTVKRVSGHVQVYETLQEFVDNTKPPYSTDIIYFIAADNALVRYSTDKDGNGKWVQLNTTAETAALLEAAIGENTAKIGTINTTLETHAANIGKNTEDIGQLNTDLTKLDERVTKAETDILGKVSQDEYNQRKEAIDTKLNAIDSSLETINGNLDDINKDLEQKASQSDLETLTGRVKTNEDDIKQLKIDVAGKASQTDFETLISKVDGHGTKLEELDGRVGTNENDIEKLKTDVAGKASSDDLSTLSSSITERFNEVDNTISGIDGRVETLENTVENDLITKEAVKEIEKDLQDQITAIQEAIGDGESEDSIKGRLSTLEETSEAHGETLDDHEGRIDTLEQNMSSLSDEISDAETGIKKRLTDVENEISDTETGIKKRLTDVENEISNSETGIKKRLTTAESEIDTLQSDLNTLESNFDGLVGDLERDYATKQYVDDAKDALEDQINDHILAANAMTYKGPVDGETNLLPTQNVRIGDTYVATKPFSLTEDINVYSSDLLIAQGTEGDDGYITADTLTWHHVPTGYSEVYNPELKVNDNTITLLDFAEGPLGSVKIVSASNNINISTENENEITLSLQWDTF